MNYSDHGTVVDGVLYSCDLSNKCSQPATSNQEVVLTMDDYVSLGTGRRALQAKSRLESARKSLRDRQEARKALEAALRLSAPVKDDFSLAEEMSKCEGLMTRTGLKRVAATEGSTASSVNSNGMPTATGRTKKSENSLKKGYVKKQSSQSTSSQGKATAVKELKADNIKKEPESELNGSIGPATAKNTHCGMDSKSVKEEPMEVTSDDLRFSEHELVNYNVPCGCCASASMESATAAATGSGWEGTASLSHGSRLRFGCLQFVISVAGHPGHSELVQALSSDVEIVSNHQ